MIDVVFFLLVFFMMASLAMTIYQGLPVNLPEAASGQRNAAETASITLVPRRRQLPQQRADQGRDAGRPDSAAPREEPRDRRHHQ